jgi:hypothetical protein
VLLVVQGFIINRLAGIPYPVWQPRPIAKGTGGQPDAGPG